MERVKKILKYVLSWGRNGMIGVLALFGLLIIVMIGVAWGEDYYEKNLKGPYDDWTNKREVSNDVSFIEKGSRGGYLYNHENICHLLDFDGKTVLRNRVIDNVMRLEYEEENLDEGYHSVTCQAACFIYTCDKHMPIHYGLMSRSGQILTKPIYESIVAVTRDLYLCQPGGVLLDSNGEEI